jgi:hypothetical protein
VSRSHHHLQATCAVGRRLAARVWATPRPAGPISCATSTTDRSR